MRIAVLGAGAWGSALAISLSKRHQINLWTKDPDHAREMNERRINQSFLPGHALPSSLKITSELPEAIENAELALLVVPIAGLRETVRAIAASKFQAPIIWGCKGFESESSKLPHQVVEEEFPGILDCGVLSGPSFAEEVAQGLPTALTLASKDPDFSRQIATELHSPRLRIYTSHDVVGVETGGAVKNVITIAAGISDGIGFGHNARAALITRGLMEITRLGLGLGGSMNTFMGLAGVGDLLLTSTGDLSRNRQVGLMLAEGKTLEDILKVLGHVAEGVHTARSVLQLGNQLNIEMPITQAVCSILHDGVPARNAVEVLLNREQKTEIY
ncbi:NAD(P)-dependent glycerol-3-phosphate dehydrogenase [Nitrosomonas sp. JL21]|uniref:NAD(P)H-dependent glycerol-3-phosphate dehydrogenase n=1 Tax=Nitrosomonas sp. JL21 TaxID=153949 RepID=UPI0013719BAC|nr:NAD(P)H-dependent glycerol-3-phosphate dehydrogenase [Nitrosomonas sp. JL21]MBL8497572.1 NAD(P)-dependent glycerol-3-phosphate dehydrogenase [Nitrosomonas sp.]MCC7090985.1 NAD(P)-dependent glycerol-3-phosphate dehydrogenase [Nitrosomonas sp.]MXS77830.1 NAD(P)-dependent glycerol-3-phosphate dehydrogenase [Nitrosomonas sp. JL21]